MKRRPTRRLLRSTEAAELIGCSHDTVTRLADRGDLASRRASARGWRRFSKRSIREFITRRLRAARRKKK